VGWGRLDDAFDDNPKIVALLADEEGLAAIGLWTVCLSWAHRNSRGNRGNRDRLGHVPSGLPRRFSGTAGRHLADLLVLYKLWELDDIEGWMIHDFDKYLSPEEAAKVSRHVTDNVTATCNNCDTELLGRRSDARYCSMACRKAANRQKQMLAAQRLEVTQLDVRVTDHATDSRDTKRDAVTAMSHLSVPPEPEPKRTTTNLAKASPEPILIEAPKIPKPRNRIVDDPDFVAFWSAYPRPVGKGSARMAWARAIKKTEPKMIIEAAQRYRDSPRRSQDLKYVPHPARWLNDERWADEDPLPQQDSDDWWDH